MDSDHPIDFAWIMIITVSITTAVWLITTFLTKPEPKAVLMEFYRRVHPSRAGWKPIADQLPDVKSTDDIGAGLREWFVGCALIYAALFGVGKIILGDVLLGV